MNKNFSNDTQYVGLQEYLGLYKNFLRNFNVTFLRITIFKTFFNLVQLR